MLRPNPNYQYPFEKLPYELENLKRTVFFKNVLLKENIKVGYFMIKDIIHPTILMVG